MGSKRLISKYILPIILKDRKPNQYYVEPFVGGGNSIDKVTGLRIGNDINKYVIEALKLIRDNPHILPKDQYETSRDMYKKIKNNEIIVSDGIKGYYGFALSFSGKFFNGWCTSKNNRDYIKEAYKNAIKQSPKLKGVKLICNSYDDFEIPNNSIIYCDPPYKNTTKYKTQDLDYDKFWNWCRKKSLNHKVFINEYNAPDDFECIWQKNRKECFNYNIVTEKLFIYKG